LSPNWGEPCAIRFLESLTTIVQSDEKKNQAANGGSGTRSSYPVERQPYSNLPLPEFALVGAVLFLGGGWISGHGFKQRVLGFVHIVGWLVMVLGGVVLLLSGLPCLANLISSM
jgi:hypothetical protein